MSQVYLMSDLHLGHKHIDGFRKLKRFPTEDVYSSEEQHELCIEGIARLSKKDLLILLGDCCFDEYWATRLAETPCRKYLVGGNHDINLNNKAMLKCFEKTFGLTCRHKYWMSHAPIHPQEMRNRVGNIHGHTHYNRVLTSEGVPDERYINVCCEYTKMAPVLWDFAVSDEYRAVCNIKWKEYKELGLVSDHK